MKCPTCDKEMRYYKDWVANEEGYQCQRCGAKKILTAIEIEAKGDDEWELS